MPRPVDYAALKRLLSPVVLSVKGVSGLGLPRGRLTVYLVSNSPQVRRQVEKVVARLAPEAKPVFEVTGPLRPQ